MSKNEHFIVRQTARSSAPHGTILPIVYISFSPKNHQFSVVKCIKNILLFFFFKF